MSVQNIIETKLTNQLSPSNIKVTNESHLHAGHAHGGVETHYKVELVTAKFDGVSNVARHQMIYKALAEEMDNPIHALVIKAYTPDEWKELS